MFGSEESSQLLQRGEVNDEWVVGRSLLGFVDSFGGSAPCCICTEAIYGFRGKCDGDVGGLQLFCCSAQMLCVHGVRIEFDFQVIEDAALDVSGGEFSEFGSINGQHRCLHRLF